jgi:hypothetical protein
MVGNSLGRLTAIGIFSHFCSSFSTETIMVISLTILGICWLRLYHRHNYDTGSIWVGKILLVTVKHSGYKLSVLTDRFSARMLLPYKNGRLPITNDRDHYRPMKSKYSALNSQILTTKLIPPRCYLAKMTRAG